MRGEEQEKKEVGMRGTSGCIYKNRVEKNVHKTEKTQSTMWMSMVASGEGPVCFGFSCVPIECARDALVL